MKFKDLKDMLRHVEENYGDRTAYILQEKEGKREITHRQFRKDVNSLGTAFIEMGLKDKRIAIIGENRYEWEVAYLAVAAGTGVVVPLDKALPENEIESLIIRSEVEAIVYSSISNFAPDIHNVFRSFPLVTLTRMAEMAATYIN